MTFARLSAAAVGSIGSVLVSLGAFGAGSPLRQHPELFGRVLGDGLGRTLATATLYLGLVLLVLAWVRLGHRARADGTSARELVRTAWWWCIPLLWAPPLFSTDLYTYLAQGAVAHAGLDPYTHVPAEIPGPVTASAAGGWSFIPTPYGPLQILLMKGVLSLCGDNVLLGVLVTRLAMMAGFALVCFAVPILCRHLGTRVENVLWLTVANPLMVLCVVSGGHNDLLMVGLLAAGTALVLTTAPAAGFALVALAAAVKAPAAVMLPFLVWVWAARRSGGRVSVRSYSWVFTTSVAVVVGTFGLCSAVAGVDLGWIRALSGNSILQPWLSIPTTLGKVAGVVLPDPARAVELSRAAGWVVLAVLTAWLWWRARVGGAAAIRAAAGALLAAVVLIPVTLPWYFTWPLVLGAAAWQTSRVAGVTAVSIWLVVSTHPDGMNRLPPWAYAVLAVFTVGVGVWTARMPEPPGKQPTGEAGGASAGEGAAAVRIGI